MKKTLTNIIALASVFSHTQQIYPDYLIWEHAEAYPSRLIHYIQGADLAGVATILSTDKTNYTIEVEVKEWWLGSLSSNRFDIGNSDLPEKNYEEFNLFETYGWDPQKNIGRDIVFYAVTNEVKYNSLPFPHQFHFEWDYAQTFTNAGPVCPPVFMPKHTPPVFLVDTNSTRIINIFSNITQSIFFTRDKMQLYRALRDARGIDDYGQPDYVRHMALDPYMTLGRHATESMLVEWLNDPLLYPIGRTNALKCLIMYHNWSPTNTVPFP